MSSRQEQITHRPVAANASLMMALIVITGLVAVVAPKVAACMAVGSLVVLFICRFPNQLLPLLIATYPLEYSKLFFPFLLLEKTVDGNSMSVVDLFRVVGLLTILYVGLGSIAQRRIFRARHPVAHLLLLLTVYSGFSAVVVARAQGEPISEFLRLAFNVLLFYATLYLMSSIGRIRLAAKSIIYTGLAMSLAGILQFFTGWYLWNSDLGVAATRVNVTFKDPNILARFILIAVVFMFCTGRLLRLPQWVRLIAIPTLILALLVTYSRSGLIALVLVVLLFWMYGMWKLRAKAVVSLACWAIAGGAFILVNQTLVQRLQTFSMGTGALGVRVALMATAIKMFADHPIFGAGIGMFRLIATQNYSFLLPYGGTLTTESHTAVLTIAAELGLVGLFLVGWLLRAMWKLTTQVPRASATWPYVISAWISVLVIFISAQSEGRLFEDPMLFIMTAAMVAGYRLHNCEAKAAACLQEPEPQAA